MARNDLVRPDAAVPHCIPKSTERSGGLTGGNTQRCSAKPCELGAEHQWSLHFDVCRRQLLSFLKKMKDTWLLSGLGTFLFLLFVVELLTIVSNVRLAFYR